MAAKKNGNRPSDSLPKVLLVERDPHPLELLGDYFKRRGISPVLAHSFQEALEFSKHHIGEWCGLVVTWDRHEPEVTKKLKALRTKANFGKTLALATSERELRDMTDLFRVGLVDYFQMKPEDPEEIVNSLIGAYGDVP